MYILIDLLKEGGMKSGGEKLYTVTGACGYVGYAIVKELISRGKRVRGAALSGEDTSHIESLGAETVFADITKPDTLFRLFDGETVVIHAAGAVSVEKKMSRRLYEINAEGTKNVVNACERRGAKLVYIGSADSLVPEAGVISEPVFEPEKLTGAYAKTKAEAAACVLESAKRGNDALVLLPSAIFGPYDYRGGAMYTLVRLYMKKTPLPIIKGGYEFTDVRDVAFAAANAAEYGKSGRAYILAGRYYDLIYAVNEMRGAKGLKPVKHKIPLPLARAAGAAAELFSRVSKKPPLFTAYAVKCVNTRVRYSSDAAKSELGYKNRLFWETIRDSLAFMERRGFLK